MVFAAPPFKYVHAFLFKHGFRKRHLNAQLFEKPFAIHRLIIKGQQPAELFVGDAAHDLMHPKGRDGCQAPFAGSAAGINERVFQDFIGILVGAFVHQIEFRKAEDPVNIVCRVFGFLQDFSVMYQNRSKGIIALLSGSVRFLVPSRPHQPMMVRGLFARQTARHR